MVRASLGAAIFCGWPVPAISQESETRGLGDGGRPGGATQLAPDVRDVAVNGMRAQHELPCDLAIAAAARDAGEDLALTTGQRDRLRPARMVRRRLHRCQRFAARADHGIGVTVPRAVRAALQRDERRAWNRGRDLTPQPVRHGAVVATMHDQPIDGHGVGRRLVPEREIVVMSVCFVPDLSISLFRFYGNETGRTRLW
jgi:hypothetical protein